MSNVGDVAFKAADSFGLIGFFWVLLLVIFLVIFCAKKAGSFHFFTDRVWAIVGGADIKNEEMNKAWSEVRDIEVFKYRTDIKIESKSDFLLFVNWINSKKLSLYQVSGLGRYFEVGDLELKNFNYKFLRILFGISSLFFLLSTVIVSSWYLPNKDAVWLYTIDTKLDFYRYENSIYVNKMILNNKICNEKNSYSFIFNKNTLSNKEVDILCENLKNIDFDEYKEVINMQWYFYLIFVIPFCWFGFSSFRGVMRLDRLIKLIYSNILYGPFIKK